MMKGQKGITLVALVITIIVMLILVGVTVSIALNGGLITKAQNAKTQWEGAQVTDNQVDQTVNYTVDGNTYTGIDNIVNGNAD